MSIEVIECGPECLTDYAHVPISFCMDSIFRVADEARGLGGLRLVEEPLAGPCLRDYDGDEEEGPTRWAKRFDVSNWVFLEAREGGHIAGRATVAFRTAEVHMLDGREDMSCLWDLRVRPEYRRHGVGRALFTYAVQWSRARECRQMKIETSNTNVRACRFYAAMGCHLGGILRHFYQPPWEHEVALFWYLDL